MASQEGIKKSEHLSVGKCSALYWKRKSWKGIKGTGVLCCVISGNKDRNEKIRSCVQDGIGERKSRLKRTCRDSRERKHQHLA